MPVCAVAKHWGTRTHHRYTTPVHCRTVTGPMRAQIPLLCVTHSTQSQPSMYRHGILSTAYADLRCLQLRINLGCSIRRLRQAELDPAAACDSVCASAALLPCGWLHRYAVRHPAPFTNGVSFGSLAAQDTLLPALADRCRCAAPHILQPRPLNCQLFFELGNISGVAAAHQPVTHALVPVGEHVQEPTAGHNRLFSACVDCRDELPAGACCRVTCALQHRDTALLAHLSLYTCS